MYWIFGGAYSLGDGWEFGMCLVENVFSRAALYEHGVAVE
jgi:carboxylesterase type B